MTHGKMGWTLLRGALLAAATIILAAGEPAAAQTGINIVQNRAKPELLLNVQGGQPLATPAARGATTAHWSIERTGDGDFVLLRNVGTGFHLHAEGGRLQAGTAQPDWLSAHWTLEYVENIPDPRLKNRATGGYLHNQDGPLVVGPAPAQWMSSLWKIISAGARAEEVIPPPPSGRCNGKWMWSNGKHVCVRNCPSGTHPVGSLCMKNCPPGFHPKGNACVKGCPPGYHPVGKTCVKDKVCPQGQHLSKGHCCPAGKNWSQVQKKCV